VPSSHGTRADLQVLTLRIVRWVQVSPLLAWSGVFAEKSGRQGS